MRAVNIMNQMMSTGSVSVDHSSVNVKNQTTGLCCSSARVPHGQVVQSLISTNPGLTVNGTYELSW